MRPRRGHALGMPWACHRPTAHTPRTHRAQHAHSQCHGHAVGHAIAAGSPHRREPPPHSPSQAPAEAAFLTAGALPLLEAYLRCAYRDDEAPPPLRQSTLRLASALAALRLAQASRHAAPAPEPEPEPEPEAQTRTRVVTERYPNPCPNPILPRTRPSAPA